MTVATTHLVELATGLLTFEPLDSPLRATKTVPCVESREGREISIMACSLGVIESGRCRHTWRLLLIPLQKTQRSCAARRSGDV